MWLPVGFEERHPNIEDDPTLIASNLDTVATDLVSSPMNCELHEVLKLSWKLPATVRNRVLSILARHLFLQSLLVPDDRVVLHDLSHLK